MSSTCEDGKVKYLHLDGHYSCYCQRHVTLGDNCDTVSPMSHGLTYASILDICYTVWHIYTVLVISHCLMYVHCLAYVTVLHICNIVKHMLYCQENVTFLNPCDPVMSSDSPLLVS